MSFVDQETLYRAFEEQHGKGVWRNGWAYFPDGSECEGAPYGFRFLPDRPTDRKHEVKILFWRFTVENLTEQFNRLKEAAEYKADTGILTDADTAVLKALREDITAAAKELDKLENPPGPDATLVRQARKWTSKRQEIAAACHEAENAYQTAEAEGTKGPKLNALGKHWQEAYERWETATTQYNRLPEDARRAAEAEIWDEEQRAKRDAQQAELEEIEI
jgi:hypothetical protein